MKVQDQSIKNLSKAYDTSLSTFYKIKNNRDHYIGKVPRRRFVEIDKSDEIVIDKLLINFIKVAENHLLYLIYTVV